MALFRLFWNAIVAYICIYVDVVIAQPGTGPDNNRKFVLIAIALYGTGQMFVKLSLALYHHIWWMVSSYSGCCTSILEEGSTSTPTCTPNPRVAKAGASAQAKK
jgi:hypothetical protein